MTVAIAESVVQMLIRVDIALIEPLVWMLAVAVALGTLIVAAAP